MNRKFYFKILLNLFDFKISHWMSGITMLNKIIFNKYKYYGGQILIEINKIVTIICQKCITNV